MGMVYTEAGKAGFITALYILIVPVINAFIFKKKNGKRVWLAVFLGLIGLYLLCVTDGFTLTKGDLLVMGCALIFTGHILSADHFAPMGNPVQMSAIQFVVASIMALAGALIFETPSFEGILSAALPIIYCGIMSGGVGYTLQIIAQRYTEPTVASLLMSLEAVFAVLAGAILLGERMSAKELIGCAIMFTAIILVQLPVKTKQKA
ncbi:MAG: DMT family transporter [Lachnospiraceae bacterium]|nr:DMT family transporter [Lachnospiraceae bacterium]